MKSEVQPVDRSQRAATVDKSDGTGSQRIQRVRPGGSDSLAGAAGRLAGDPLAALRQPDHRPAPSAGRARNLQQRGRPLSATALSASFGSRSRTAFRICTSAGATTASIGTSNRRRSSSPAATPARPATTRTIRAS